MEFLFRVLLIIAAVIAALVALPLFIAGLNDLEKYFVWDPRNWDLEITSRIIALLVMPVAIVVSFILVWIGKRREGSWQLSFQQRVSVGIFILVFICSLFLFKIYPRFYSSFFTKGD